MAAKRTLPAHGTTARYRRDCRCEKCKAANSRAKRQQRARARIQSGQSTLRLVPDVQTAPHPEPQQPPQSTNAGDRYKGPMEAAILQDLATVDASTRPFFNTLRAAALSLARELDDLDSKSSKAPLVAKIVDVVREIKGKEEGDDDPLTQLLGDLGVDPSGFPAAPVRDEA